MKTGGDPTYLAKACAGGAFNGQIPSGSGPQTISPTAGQPSGLDAPQIQSKNGVLNKGKPQSLKDTGLSK